MDCHDLDFWKETSTLCRDIAERTRQKNSETNMTLWRAIEIAAEDVPMRLAIACRPADASEQQAAVLQAFAGLQIMTRMLFALALCGEIGIDDCREYLCRGTHVYCRMLVFAREHCA